MTATKTTITAIALAAAMVAGSVGAAFGQAATGNGPSQGLGGNVTGNGDVTAPANPSGTGLGPTIGANGRGVANGSGLDKGAVGSAAGATNTTAPNQPTSCLTGAHSAGNTAASGTNGTTGVGGAAPNTMPDSTSSGTSSSC